MSRINIHWIDSLPEEFQKLFLGHVVSIRFEGTLVGKSESMDANLGTVEFNTMKIDIEKVQGNGTDMAMADAKAKAQILMRPVGTGG